jgi:hypothetical protein
MMVLAGTASELAQIFRCYILNIFMEKSSRGRSQDRSKVAGGKEYELQYEKEKTGASKEQIKKAIKTEGNQRKKWREN